jgi:hypothetical protein
MIQNIIVKISGIFNEPEGNSKLSTVPLKMYIKVSHSRRLVFLGVLGRHVQNMVNTDRILRQPLNLYFPQALQLELDAFKQSLPGELKQNCESYNKDFPMLLLT